MRRTTGAILGGLGGAALGGALLYRWSRHHKGNLGIKVDKAVTVAESPGGLYRFWRKLENLPHIMSNVESVRTIDDRRSHWAVKAPGGTRIEWDAEIINDIPGELIAWRTLEGQVAHAGSVRFEPTVDGQTRIRVSLQYDPPAGELGHGVAALLGADAGRQIAQDLDTFKMAWERGTLADRVPW